MARRVSQSEWAYTKLRQRIRDKLILPGEFLSENVIARELGMSRTPVREAVQRLVQEGLFIVLPSRGFMVASLTVKDVEEIYAIRESLEGLSARLAAGRAAPEGVKRLKERLDEIASVVAARDFERYYRLDSEFHEEIAILAGSQRLIRLLENMRSADVLRQLNPSMLDRQTRLERSLEEHRVVVAAIVARDPDGAENAMRSHAQSAVRDVVLGAFGMDGR